MSFIEEGKVFANWAAMQSRSPPPGVLAPKFSTPIILYFLTFSTPIILHFLTFSTPNNLTFSPAEHSQKHSHSTVAMKFEQLIISLNICTDQGNSKLLVALLRYCDNISSTYIFTHLTRQSTWTPLRRHTGRWWRWWEAWRRGWWGWEGSSGCPPNFKEKT